MRRKWILAALAALAGPAALAWRSKTTWTGGGTPCGADRAAFGQAWFLGPSVSHCRPDHLLGGHRHNCRARIGFTAGTRHARSPATRPPFVRVLARPSLHVVAAERRS